MRVRVVAVIPARMGSSRFPGKPLLPVRGLPMVEHVRRRAVLCEAFSEVVVATCDREIAEAIASHGGRYLMTSPAHLAATDRVCEAMQQLDATHVVNVQGDELLVLPEDLRRMVEAMQQEPQAPAWNAVASIEHEGELADHSIVKCSLTQGGRFLFCAREMRAMAEGLKPPYEPLRKVLGIIGYTREFLESYGRLRRTPLELATSIDQLRILEQDVPLRAVEFHRGYPGINEPRDVELVETCLHGDAAQQRILGEVLA